MDTQNNKRSAGPIIGIIVVVILMIIGALYFWIGKPSVPMTPAVSSSDDLNSLESDLNATSSGPDLSNLDN